MKLIVIKAVASFREDIVKLLKKAAIETFSVSEVNGYSNSQQSSLGWFPGEKEGVATNMFFAFTSAEKADELVEAVKSYNKCDVENKDFCLKVAVLPVEQYV